MSSWIQSPLVVKLGGAALKASLENSDLLKSLSHYQGPMIVVHGGGPTITFMAKALGIESEFIDGQRITTPEMMNIAEMVLSGNVSSKIVRSFLKSGRASLGISGTDNRLLECVVENPKLQCVGRVERINISFLKSLLAQGLSPVISPVGIFSDFTPCNVNADLAATRIASELKSHKFLFITDTDGIYDAQKKTIPFLSSSELQSMCHSGAIAGGMKVKARAILEYLQLYPEGSAQVINGLDSLAFERFLKDGASGTVIKN